MLALGDTRHGGAGLALAPRAQRYDVPGLKALEGCLLKERKIRIEIASGLSCLDDAVHGAANHYEIATSCASSVCYRADARDVRSKGGNRDAPRRLLDEPI
jgi:hypothetical protein